MTAKRVVVGADHAGFMLKNLVAGWLRELGATVINLGTDGPDRVDYPDFAHEAAKAILAGNADQGVLVCGTGVGMAMAANKHPGIRAVVCSERYSAAMARAHNDGNILCFGARVVGPGVAEEMVEAFLQTPFDGGRHTGRVAKIAGQSTP